MHDLRAAMARKLDVVDVSGDGAFGGYHFGLPFEGLFAILRLMAF